MTTSVASPRHPEARGEQVVELVTAARAATARLALELRTLSHKAEVAEREMGGGAVADSSAAGARDLLTACLAQYIDARRSELAEELDEARAEAASVVASAHRRAEAYVAAAHDDVLGALAHPTGSLPPLAPLPPVVDPTDIPPPDSTAVLAVAGASPPLRRAVMSPRRQLAWKRLLYPDVLLPLVAVVAVLIVLLAWVG